MWAAFARVLRTRFTRGRFFKRFASSNSTFSTQNVWKKSSPSGILTSLVLVLQYILRHKARYRRSDRKFVWPFLLLFYTGARPWKKVLNFPDLFATPDPTLDKRWIFKLPFKFARLFGRSKKRQVEDDPWLDAFLELTRAAERIVAKKDATAEDWKNAWNDALSILTGKIDPDNEEDGDIFNDFTIFVSKVAIRQGWKPPTREEITYKLEKLGGIDMAFKIESIYDLGVYEGEQRGEQRGEQKTLREMLESCITLRFPRIAQPTVERILSIADVNVLKSIFKVACTADSLDKFQKDIRGIAPIN